MKNPVLYLSLSMIFVAASAPANALTVKAAWPKAAGCTSTAPQFSLSGIPKGTAKLDFKMVDLNFVTFQHGGGTVDYTGKNSFAAGELFTGMFSSYIGPCPRMGDTHSYQWTVKALDSSGNLLDEGNTVLPFKR